MRATPNHSEAIPEQARRVCYTGDGIAGRGAFPGYRRCNGQ